ncbi:TonB-dependent receptor [Bordetella genomosp. 10]|nr:TonB-dependent receptor [Bordetella genomosp. 10]
MSRHPVRIARQTASIAYSSSFRPTSMARAVQMAFIGGILTVAAWQPQARAQAAAPQPGQAAAKTRHYDISAGPLSTVLARFASESGILLAAAGQLTQGKNSPGVRGTLDIQAALNALLADTGLEAVQDKAGTYVLRPLPADATRGAVTTLPTVSVTGAATSSELLPAYAGGQVATGGQVGMLGARSVMDTPFNVTNYTSKRIEDQQARTIADVVADDPSVRSTGVVGRNLDNFMVRGFSLSNSDIFYNGLPGVLPHDMVSADYAERVEILKGASALLYGIESDGSIGGAINVVPKHATDDPITRITASYVSKADFGTHLDYGRRFGENKEWGIRFNGTIMGGDTAIDNGSEHHGNAVLGVDYRGDRFRFSLDGGYQETREAGQVGFIFPAYGSSFDLPRPPKGADATFPDWTRGRSRDTFGMARAEYDLTDNWTAYAAVGGRHNTGSRLIPYEQINDSAGSVSVNPAAASWAYDTFSSQAGIRGAFDTGPVKHAVSLAANYANYRGHFGQTVFPAQTGSLYDPDAISSPAGYQYKAPLSAVTHHTSVALADTLSILDGRAQLTLGERHQQIRTTNYNTTTGAVSGRYDKGVWTPAVGLVVKPWENVSLYANYIEGLQAGTTVGSTYANAGEVLPPYVSKQYETGVKVDWGRFTTTASVFQITQPSGSVSPTTNIYSANGEQRNRGVELNVFGEVTSGVRLLGGVAFTDARLTRTTSSLTQGNKAAGVPDVQANLSGEWDLPFIRGLTLTGRVVYTSSQYVDSTNQEQQSIPAWTRFDLGARYVWERPGGKPITFRADVINVANRNYWAAYTFNSNLVTGAPRTIMLSATYEF